MRVTVVLLTILTSTALWAGPLLVCFPWVEGESKKLATNTTAELMELLDSDGIDTLQRLEALRLFLLAHEGKAAATNSLLKALEERVREGVGEEVTAARFDLLMAQETLVYLRSGGTRGQRTRLRQLGRLVVALEDDAGAWLAVARAVHPLMRTGTLGEHAVAFVLAYDLATSTDAGPGCERVMKALKQDLDTLESYVLDEDLRARGIKKPKPADRVAELRRLAQEEMAASKMEGKKKAPPWIAQLPKNLADRIDGA